MNCQLCGGPCGCMGTLGLLSWHRCRDCGMEFSKRHKPKPWKPWKRVNNTPPQKGGK